MVLFHVRKHTSLDIMVYSGYTLEEILKGPPAMVKILSLVDILIDGRYRQDLPTSKIWRGSSNQIMHLLSKRSQKYSGYIDALYGRCRSLQVEFADDTNFHIIGIPGRDDLSRLRKHLFHRGIHQK